ncbi:restriction endonuclease [Solidesulfovibrio sp.]|uniref:restriction endonuclease n=1 Tax=Solidesulfovibrio sp. TaxID=2910990 RepID=UPI00344B80DC
MSVTGSSGISGVTPVDRPTGDKLLGAVSTFAAAEGLFVSGGGFEPNAQKELAARLFRVRLWSQRELFEQLFSTFEKLDEDLKAELPLKRIWTDGPKIPGRSSTPCRPWLT